MTGGKMASEFVKIGDVKVPILEAKNPELVPAGFASGSQRQQLVQTLKWMLQKDQLKQDIFLIGAPGFLRSSIVLQFLELCNREMEYLAINWDTTEADIKQRREIRAGSAFYTDLCAVKAALNGRVFVIDGVEKAERNVLPILNNLLENREMQLDDGRFLMAPDKFDQLRELLQRRKMLNNGDTIWEDSQLVRAAKEGALSVLDGIDRVHWSMAESIAFLVHHRFLELPDGTRLVGQTSFDLLRQRTGLDEQGLNDRKVFKIAQNFRLIALGDSDSAQKWLNPQMCAQFVFSTLPEQSVEERLRLIQQKVPNVSVESAQKLFRLVERLGHSHASVRAIGTCLSLRRLVHILHRQARNPEEGIHEALHRAALSRFLPVKTYMAAHSRPDKLNVAYHEAGHALFSMMEGCGTLRKITILPEDTNSAGYTEILIKEEARMTGPELRTFLKFKLAGGIAEQFGHRKEEGTVGGDGRDLSDAASIVGFIVRDFNSKRLPGMEPIEPEQIMEQARAELWPFFERNKLALGKLTVALYRQGTIKAAEARTIVGLPPSRTIPDNIIGRVLMRARHLRKVRTLHSVNWFSFFVPSKLFLFAGGIPNSLLQCHCFQNGTLNSIVSLLERDIALASLYGRVKFELANGFPTGLNIFKNARQSLLFDIQISSEQPIHSAPLGLAQKLADHLGDKSGPFLYRSAWKHDAVVKHIFDPLYQLPAVDKRLLANLMVDFFLSLKQRKVQIQNHYLPELLLKIVADAKMWTCLQQLLQYRVIEDSKFLAFELISRSAECPALFQIALDMLSRRGNSEQIAEVLLQRGHILDALRFISEEPGDQRTDKICLELIKAAWNKRPIDRPLKFCLFSHLERIGRLKGLEERLKRQEEVDEFKHFSAEFECLYADTELKDPTTYQSSTRFR